MPNASLTVLGTFALHIDGRPVRGFPTDKARALLAYLALEANRPHTRALLAALLWPDVAEEAALSNLRNTAYRLRSTLDAAAPGLAKALLTSTRQSFQLDAALLHLDSATFERLLAQTAAHAHPALYTCEPCLARLAEAVALYWGELLAGFGLPDAPLFEEWLLARRDLLQRAFVDALGALASAHEQRGEYERAHGYATRLLSEDPFREEAHRLLMRLLARRGLAHQALAQYAACRQLLQTELGVEPDPQTTALYEQIRRGEVAGRQADKQTQDTRHETRDAVSPSHVSSLARSSLASPPLPLTPSPLQDWGEMPAVASFNGREGEQATLARWLLDEHCRLVCVLGIGGVGKTTLAAFIVRAAAAHFDAVIWRSLLNAPPPLELLRDLLHSLAADSAPVLPDSLDALVRLVLKQLRQRRCLLVLDNGESILQPGATPGALRPGYEGYASLLQQLGGSEHQSCLVLTSREQPQALERLVGHTSAVRLLPLGGLDADAGHTLLQQHGLATSENEAAALVAHYSGNPLALQIVANTIVALFDGDVAAFWHEAAGVFDTIRQVLDEQWERLSESEREVLFWLAIERVPVPLATLRADLVQPPSPRVLLESVQGLRKRSLLEQRGPNLALQNVVIEYLTERLIARLALELEGAQLDWLHRYALLKTDTAEYVRQSQLRVFVEPTAQQLVAAHGIEDVGALVRRLLDALRGAGQRQPSYAAGNLLNLLTHLQIDLAGYDFSGLSVWQADLREVTAFDTNFAKSHFAHPAFSDVFDAVNSVAFSPDGALVAAGSSNGVVGVWRVANGQRHTLFVGHASSVWSVAFSPDGCLLASASSDATVRLWDVASGRLIMALADHNRPVRAAAWIPGTSLLVSGGDDGTLRVWDTRDGICQCVLDGHEDGIRALAVDPAGVLVAAADAAGRVHLWRISDAKQLSTLTHPQPVECVAFRADGGQLVSGCHDAIARVWDVGTGQPLHQLEGHRGRVYSARWSPDGNVIATGSMDTTICLWDTRSDEPLRVLRGHVGNVNGLDWSPDGALVVSAGHDETIRVWSAQSGDALRVLQGNAAGVLSLTFGSTSATLYSTQGHEVRVWDVQQRRRRRILRGHRDVVSNVSASHDGAYLASASRDSTVRVWDAAHGRTVHVLAGHTSIVTAVAWSPKGGLLASASYDASVRLWDVRSGQLVRSFIGHPGWVTAVSFSPDGALLISGGDDGTVRLWDVARGQLLNCLAASHQSVVQSVAVSPNGALLAYGSSNGVVIIDMRSGQYIRTLEHPNSSVSYVAFSPDSSRLASSSSDRVIRLWDIGSWEAQALGYHTSWVSAVAWSADGTLLASSSTLGEIVLWDGRTGARVGELRDAGPYAGMNIAGASGLTDAQHKALIALGAVDDASARGRYPAE